jgi:hypothetical protein
VVILANCLAHGRRRFFEIAEAKEQQLSPRERLFLHQQRSGPVRESLHQSLKEQFAQKQVEPNSSLGQCISHLLRHWKELTLFLRQPGAPLDNNICARALKKAQAN